MPIQNNRIVKPYIILCEGKDAMLFLIRFLESKDLGYDARFANGIQVLDFGGNENLPAFLKSFKNMEGFDKISSLLIVRDAERDAKKAQTDIKGALKNACLSVPESCNIWVNDETEDMRISYTLFPNCSGSAKNGTLEDLCWSILSEENIVIIKEQITQFIDQLKLKQLRDFPRQFKSRLHTYFSVTDEYVSMKIGEAAAANAFDWSSNCLQPLKQLIENGF